MTLYKSYVYSPCSLQGLALAPLLTPCGPYLILYVSLTQTPEKQWVLATCWVLGSLGLVSPRGAWEER